MGEALATTYFVLMLIEQSSGKDKFREERQAKKAPLLTAT
jgi:hypothetical protein